MNYSCEFCGQRFVTESRFMKHECKEMKRHKILKDPIGQSAWLYYQKWMQAYNRRAPNANAFVNSRYFSSFVKFAEFVKRAKIVDVTFFIELMKSKDISPTIWTNDQVLGLYLEQFNKRTDHERHVEITIDTLFTYADDHNIDVSDFFDHVEPYKLFEMIGNKSVSPWIILNSTKFVKYFNNLNADQKIVLESLIRPTFWAERFKKQPDLVSKMKEYVKELNI